MRISIFPQDPRPSGWYAILPEAPPVRRLSGRQTADWIVVGAGFTGVAAARRLGELAPNSRIALIELVGRTLALGLDLLGIEHPEQM